MSNAARSILPPHVRRRRASFVLTSLIDVIFLLVIFFMVSSQIVPFSVIGLGPIASEKPADASAPPRAGETAPVAIRIMAGQVRIAGASAPLDAVAPALATLKANGVTALLLIPTATASVQDVVSVLEAVKAAGIETVTVLNRKAQQP